MRQQEHCRNCGSTTLHELDPNPVNHILHLLATLFLCGFWLPIWMLIALTAPKRYMRCLTCGQIPGMATPKDKEAAARQRAEYVARRNEAIGHAAHAAGSVAADAAAVAAKTTAKGVGAVTSAALAGVRQSLRQVDRVTLAAAGDDVFMAWFFRVALMLAMLIVGGIVLYLAARSFGLT